VGALLRTRFQCLGEPEDLWLDAVGPRREYWVKSRQCSFEAHTERYADGDDSEVVRSALDRKDTFSQDEADSRPVAWPAAVRLEGRGGYGSDPGDCRAAVQTYAPTYLLG